MRRTALLGAALAVLAGCGESSELPKDQDAKLRNNLNRALTPEEVAKMNGGGDKTKGPDQGAGGGFHKPGAGAGGG